MCEGDVLLKKWEQGNTLFGKALNDPISRGLFLCKFFASILIPASSPLFPTNT